MKIFRGLDSYKKNEGVALTIGSFDGVHHGHQEIIRALRRDAIEKSCLSAIMTFSPHPRIVLKKDSDKLRLLNTDSEKEALFEELGVDLLFMMPFNKEFLSQSADEFLQNMLIEKLGMKHIVLGYDHRFGNRREGDVNFLKEHTSKYGYTVDEIPAQTIDDLGVSSTKIRNALENGQVALANRLLGYAYRLEGKVVKGDQIGRKIGYPTANIQVSDQYKLIPADGVYAVQVNVANQWLAGMGYIGTRPTVNGKTTKLEVNLLDWEGDLYGQDLCVRLVTRVRPDEKFDNLEALKAQIAEDELHIRALLR
jgi:riboflavin kinase/FMN adenylyltransferase